MPFSDIHRRQVQLLVRALPLVAQEECFALKGGTAINLFYRDLPRLSVDIDLTYLPLADRAQSLAGIDAALRRIGERIRESDPRIRVQESSPNSQTEITRLVVRTLDGVQIKIEVTPVLRGVVFEPEKRLICEPVEEEYGFAEMPVLSFPDLYAGKCIAALDRQHPRDLFDVHELLNAEGITPDLRTALIVYLISHGRPPHRLLSGECRDITHEYEHGFQGMTATDLPMDALRDAHARLVEDLVAKMPEEHKAFLYGFFEGAPEWELLGIPGCEELPAVKWRQLKLAEAPQDERTEMIERLKEILT